MKSVWVRIGVMSFFFLSLLALSGSSSLFTAAAEAAERGYTVGEMVSNGKVMFEAKEQVWKSVVSPSFPVLRGVKFKTEEGNASLSLADHCQINVGPNGLFSFEQNDQFLLAKGTVHFRLSPSSDLNIKVGALSVIKPRILQASRGGETGLPRQQDTVGSIQIHPNGSVTVESIGGQLSVLQQDRKVLAALSSKETVTIPAGVAAGNQTIAQAGDVKKGSPSSAGKTTEEGSFWTSTGAIIGYGVIAGGAVVAGVIIAHNNDDDHDHGVPGPICR